MKAAAVAFVVLALGATYSASAEPGASFNCRPDQPSFAPMRNGPLALKAVYCQSAATSSLDKPIVSPDGRSIAVHADIGTTLKISKLETFDAWSKHSTELSVFADFGGRTAGFAWSKDSRSLWTSEAELRSPGAFLKAPIRPASIDAGGSVRPLDVLNASNRPLDALLWVGHDGLAVAQFGTRGRFYRPEHDDPAPTIAMVDAARGIVLDEQPLAPLLPPERAPGSPAYAAINSVAAVILGDGRVQITFRVLRDHWVTWRQGEQSRKLALLDDGRARAAPTQGAALSPDGSRLLIALPLIADGPICESPHLSTCPPPVPVEGVLAALYDLADGREVWTIRARAVLNAGSNLAPAIAADGRFALVTLPTEQDGDRFVGLVSMTDGSIIQKIPAPPNLAGFGFVDYGRIVWTYGSGITPTYSVAGFGRR